MGDVSPSLVRHFDRHFQRDNSTISVDEVHLLAGAWIFSEVCMDELIWHDFYIAVLLYIWTQWHCTYAFIIVLCCYN